MLRKEKPVRLRVLVTKGSRGSCPPAYQSLVCALEHVTDEMEAAASRGLAADEPEVVHVSNTLWEAGERKER